ncbi:BZIP domain-containing protein [Heracleum sosnowskyi]|uniref:BZIP domain-containing protein n=1 Tax=Heracleum sosnowskyi TaxID=360622 RepID=A0AAD8IX27_9APIA|nr:BZIP domain-containing protein [Heracleum sosnowskyi]
MASNSSGSTQIENSGCDKTEQIRKRKRMQSNRESARRSRLRKQQHLDELSGQVSQLKKENEQLLTKANITTQHLMNVESENLILKAQMDELSQRLESLNDIVNYVNINIVNTNNNKINYNNNNNFEMFEGDNIFGTESFMNPWYLNQQPIMASSDMFQY